jgi:PilZ domain-containing protein
MATYECFSLVDRGIRQMKTENQRRSDRVNIRVPVRVSAVDATGQKFSAQGHTLTISRHGATIALNRKLTSGLNLTICPGTSKRESNAIVMGQIGGQSGVHVYGIAVLEPNVNLWGIQFPPLAESEEGLVKLLLECSACNAREVVYLNELETDVFEGNHSLPRSCSQCATWTHWLQTSVELPAGHPGVQFKTVPESSVTLVDRAQNKRKYVRVQVKMKACIHHPGFEEEIVEVKDVSRGGFSFVSSKGYIEGSRIEVAVPFSGGKANIFVAARINRAQELPGKGLTKYGAQYIRSR